MTEKISLTPYIRALLLEEICSRMDIIEYCKQTFHLKLNHFKGSCYKGKCPFCRHKNVSLLSKKTGHFSCPHCKKVSDFLHIIAAYKDYDLNETLAYISDYLEKAEELELAHAGGEV
jgi:glutaredoxin